SHWGRARALNALGRHREAVADWDQVIRLDAGSYRTFFRVQRALALARAGEPVRAVRQVEQLGVPDDAPGNLLYELARVGALAARAAAREAARPLPEREKRAEQYAR